MQTFIFHDLNIFKTISHKPLNSRALDPLEILRVTQWDGLSFSLMRKEMAPLCTNKLTQEKCQRMKFCCSGGKTKIIVPLFCFRSGDTWLVQMKGYGASMKVSIEASPFLPPTNGWWFYKGGGVFEEDPTLTCSPPSNSPPCCLTVTLSGAAKEAHGDCEGEYKSTGLISMGKQVIGTLQTFVISNCHLQRCSN